MTSNKSTMEWGWQMFLSGEGRHNRINSSWTFPLLIQHSWRGSSSLSSWRANKKKYGCTVLNRWNLSGLSSCPLSSESLWWAFSSSTCFTIDFSHAKMEPCGTRLGLTCPSHRSLEQCLWWNSASSPHAFSQLWPWIIAFVLFHLVAYLAIALGTLKFNNSHYKFCWVSS